MKGITVFVGPTCSVSDLPNSDSLDIRPPVAEGDLFRAIESGARLVGIIDGYFESQPAVWHKEIIWAIHNGAVVAGAASMGALRAAELERCGMVGIGEIYQAYADGVLEDDDEVAVAHGPETLGFPAVSEAMVNVRWSVREALEVGAVCDWEADLLLSAAKSIFFKDRTWQAVEERLLATGLSKARSRELVRRVLVHRVNQKERDAVLLLEYLASLLAVEPGRIKSALPSYLNTPAFRRSKARATAGAR